VEIVYGTQNVAKYDSMKVLFKSLEDEYGLNLLSLNELDFSFPEVDETGANTLDNARLKAYAYYDIIKKPVFSIDSGLYLNDLPDKLQPGLMVRRINGKRLNDEEMVDYYSKLAVSQGGKIAGRYRNGICFVLGDGKVFEYAGEDIASELFYITPKPHEKSVEGFPIDRLSVHIESNQYYYDREFEKEEAWNTEKGLLKFFRAVFDTIKQGELA